MLIFTGNSSRRTAVVTLLASIAAAAPLTAQDRPLTADFPEVYRAGGLNAPDWAQFSGGGPVGFDGAGNLYILDPGASQVVAIDARGQLVRTIGRSGEGPGEFGFPFKLVVWRDGRFAVEDLQRDAIYVFGPGGEFDHSVTIGFQTSLTTLRPDPNGDALYAQGSSRGSRITDAFSELVEGDAETPKDELDDFSIGRIELDGDVVVPRPRTAGVARTPRRSARRNLRGRHPGSLEDALDSVGRSHGRRVLRAHTALGCSAGRRDRLRGFLGLHRQGCHGRR